MLTRLSQVLVGSRPSRSHRRWFLGSLLALAACGGDGGGGEPGGTNGGSTSGQTGAAANGASGLEDGGPSQNLDGGTGGSTTGGTSTTGTTGAQTGGSSSTFPTEAACSSDQERCRGACFDTVGQKKNGCELVMKSTGDLKLAGHLDVPGVLIAKDLDGLVAISTSDFKATKLDSLSPSAIHTVDGGFLYYGSSTIYKVSLSGGTPTELVKLTKPVRAGAGAVHGGYFYFYYPTDKGIYRVSLAGGKEELVVDDIISGAVFDDQYIYTSGSFPTSEIRRRAWSTPGTFETLYNDPKVANAKILAVKSSPLFWYQDTEGKVLSIARSGGQVSSLYTFADGTRVDASLAQTPSSLVYAHASMDTPSDAALELCQTDGKRCVKLDIGSSEGTVAEDGSSVYVARDTALFKIAKSAL